MTMEDLVLLGGFAAIAVFGYFIMARWDNFLDKIRQKNEKQEQTACLNIAASCFGAVPAVSNILNDINCRYPNVHCNLSVGNEQEVIESFDNGEADVAIISADSDVQSGTPAQWKYITLTPQPFSVDNGNIEANAVKKTAQHQKVLWKDCGGKAWVVYFIHSLCGRQE